MREPTKVSCSFVVLQNAGRDKRIRIGVGSKLLVSTVMGNS